MSNAEAVAGVAGFLVGWWMCGIMATAPAWQRWLCGAASTYCASYILSKMMT